MLCPSCRRQTGRKALHCPSCGTSLDGVAPAVLEVVLRDGKRIPLVEEVTIGRGPGNTLQLSDPSVSRHHARITPGVDSSGTAWLEDTGSTFGTLLDGLRLEGAGRVRDGSRIRLGDQELLVERRRNSSEAGRTIVVQPGDSLVLPASGGSAELASVTAEVADRPRLRSGYALKRLEAGEGTRRWVLKDLRSGRFRHFSDADAGLVQLLDGQRPLDELARAAERQLGAAGPARLARLLADLAERGLLAGGDGADAEASGVEAGTSGLLRPREKAWAGAGELFERLYRRGGWLLFTRTAGISLLLLASLGIVVFGFLVVGRYGTPFVVAHKIGVGGLVFVLGRFAVVAFHETAHGLAMASFGRRVRKAGLKLLLVFPYAYVDTSDMWFEPRRRRIAVSAAGPISDFVLGAVFSLCCLTLSAGTVRDIFFQLAFAAYLGALFNLNPMLERDGYHVLVDVLREPGLRRRAREQLRASLSGGGGLSSSPVLRRYAFLSLAWTVAAAIFVAALSLRYERPLDAIAPTPVAWTLLAGLWLALLTPVVLLIGPPLRERLRPREG
jgi:putative peptide zinc metalloprotease protein